MSDKTAEIQGSRGRLRACLVAAGLPPTSLAAPLSPFFAGLLSAAVPHELVFARALARLPFPLTLQVRSSKREALSCSLLGPTCVSS